MTDEQMDRGLDQEQVIATLQAHERELRHRGVRHAALLGSLARGGQTPVSDIGRWSCTRRTIASRSRHIFRLRHHGLLQDT